MTEAGTTTSAPVHLAADHVLRRIQPRALIAGGAGLIACVVGVLVSPEQFFRSYLVAYLFWLGIALGCLAVLMIQYITGGMWGAVVRRVLESATRTLPLLLVLFLPLTLGLADLYEWARPEVVAHDPILQHKQAYLNVPFFLARAAFYFAVWIVLARVLNAWSLRQDDGADPALALRMENLSRGGLVLYGLTMTFASVDWAMSLEPHWFSTIYGVIFMGGQGLSAFVFVIVIAALLADRPPLSTVLTADRFHDLGKLMLGFVMLWAYFALSQFLITWAGNSPEEIPWYLRRMRGGWQVVGVGLFVVHFALPFVVLLSRSVKRRARSIATVACVLIVARFIDLFWLLRPASTGSAAVHWLDVATVVAVGGVWIWAFVGQLGNRPLLPLHDPALAEEG
jgi:hypothetical protein